MIPRLAQKEVAEALALEAAVALIGPRQVGKTTLARQIGDECEAVYLDLENSEDLARLEDPARYVDSLGGRLLILDEIHRRPGLFPILRGIIDEGRRKRKEKEKYTGRFLILGSASGRGEMDLLRQSGESLAGRISYVEIPPLTMQELSSADTGASLDAMQQQRWLRGGFPEILLAESDRASMALRKDFIRTYLERDIPMFGLRIPVERLRRLWTMLAHRQASLLNQSELARSLELSSQSVSRYIDLLVDLLLLRRLMPYHANLGKRLVKSPKVYVRDSGLLHALLGLETMSDLVGHPIIGASWEGYVVEEICNALPWGTTPFFYRTAVGAEIDLLLEHPGGELWAIEIKRSTAGKVQRGFHQARADVKPARSFVVHSGLDHFPLREGVEAVSVPGFLKELALWQKGI